MNDITYIAKHLRTYNVDSHCHDTWELIYCTGGTGVFSFFNGITLEYKRGDIVIIPPKTQHENKSTSGFTNIHLNISNGTIPFTQPTLITDDSEQHILTVFKDIFYFYNSNLNKKQIIISAFGNLLTNYLVAFHSNKPLSKMVEVIKADIVKNFPDCNYSLEDFMHSLPFSYDYLRKLFKNEIGVTPHNYLMDMRMQTAEKLLLTMYQNEYNISMIAIMCGFSEPLYFSRVFKKHFGCSPSNYLNKKNNQ